MTPGTPAKVIAATMGLAGFAIAIFAGLSADNPTDSILTRAIISLLVCNALGFVIGAVGEKAVSIPRCDPASEGPAAQTGAAPGPPRPEARLAA